MLQLMGLQKVGLDLLTEQQQYICKHSFKKLSEITIIHHRNFALFIYLFIFNHKLKALRWFPDSSVGKKKSTCNSGDTGSGPGS